MRIEIKKEQEYLLSSEVVAWVERILVDKHGHETIFYRLRTINSRKWSQLQSAEKQTFGEAVETALQSREFQEVEAVIYEPIATAPGKLAGWLKSAKSQIRQSASKCKEVIQREWSL